MHKLHRTAKMKTRKIPLGEFLVRCQLVPVSMAHMFVKRSRSRITQIVDAGFVVVYTIEGAGFLSLAELNTYLTNAKPGPKGPRVVRKKGKHLAEQKQLL